MQGGCSGVKIKIGERYGFDAKDPAEDESLVAALTGAEVFVKYENMQVTNAFKERGARVKLGSLSAQERKRGVIAMSAGNHAQAVALAEFMARNKATKPEIRDAVGGRFGW